MPTSIVLDQGAGRGASASAVSTLVLLLPILGRFLRACLALDLHNHSLLLCTVQAEMGMLIAQMLDDLSPVHPAQVALNTSKFSHLKFKIYDYDDIY